MGRQEVLAGDQLGDCSQSMPSLRIPFHDLAQFRSWKLKRYDVSEIESKCFEILDEVSETGKPVLVTKNGVPHVEMIPFGYPQGSNIDSKQCTADDELDASA